MHIPTIEEVKLDVEQYMKAHPNWRPGQALFNYIEINFNEFAEEIRADETIDTYYRDTNIDACYERMIENQIIIG